MKHDATSQPDEFYADLDTAKGRGRGSCCTAWSFGLLFVTLFLFGVAVLLGFI